MSVDNDLQIHSDHQDDGFELQEIEPKPKVIRYIGHDAPKKFYIAVSVALLALAFVFFIACCISVFPLIGKDKKKRSRKNYVGKQWDKILGMNNRKLYNGYVLFTTILVVVALGLVAVFPELGRKRKRYILGPAIFFGLWYLSWFFIAYQSFFFEYGSGYSLGTIWAYLIFFNASAAAFVASLTANRKPKLLLSLAISGVLHVAEVLFMWLVSKNSSPQAYMLFFRLIIQSFVSAYICLDLEFMFKNRYDFYQVGDWFLGFCHILTDWTFRFWHDMVVKRKRVPRPPQRGIEKVLDSSANTIDPEPTIVEAETPKVRFAESNAATEAGEPIE